MRLNPAAREYFICEIVTDPAVAAWEASFDGGVTYSAATTVDGNPAWLVAGPDFDPDLSGITAADYTPLTLGRVIPEVRAIDDPEVIVRNAPPIDVRA